MSDQKVAINAMQSPDAAGTRTRAKLCGAKTRKGQSCRTPAMPNGRCRMHGGTNPGAPKGNRNAWKHGHRSAEHQAMRILLRMMRQDLVQF